MDRAVAYYRRRSPDRWLMTNLVVTAITCVATRRLLEPPLRDPETCRSLIAISTGRGLAAASGDP